jgi:hypothetical protein
MAISVKGIQYSYQIDFFNQVPTHVQSQVHQLPPISEPQATPIDQKTSLNERVIDPTPDTGLYEQELVEPASSSARNIKFPDNGLQNKFNVANEILNKLELPTPPEEPLLPLPDVNKTIETAEEADIAQIQGSVLDSQLDRVEFENGFDSQVQENFQKTNRSYRPNELSFLQRTGYEAYQKLISENQLAQELGILPIQVNTQRQELNEIAAPATTPKIQTEDITFQQNEVVDFPEIENPQAEPNKPRNFLQIHAQSQYQFFSSEDAAMATNKVDFYF